ncbi:MAG: hypothetical protein IPK16_19965 [Anaerolineales bacterium]|nr:hypothetical protein [Anaerolineales bacterium]
MNAAGKVTWISIDAAPLPLPGYGVISAYTDITDRKRAEDVLLRFNDELEQQVAERTVQLESALAQLRHADETKDAFLASVSHELRTPLTGVLGMADALEMQFSGPLNERQLYYVQQIRVSGNRLLALVDAVLGYTALIAGRVLTHTLPCRLLDLAIKSLHTIRPYADAKHQALRFSVDPDDLEIASDPQSIIQVLDNLLDNAVKFTPDGGKVALEITYDVADEVVKLTVWDTGIGIAPEQQEAIFKPFSQVDSGLNRLYTGVGLGLASSFQIVRILGGTITVESQLGKGSRFIVTLPTKPLPKAGQQHD